MEIAPFFKSRTQFLFLIVSLYVLFLPFTHHISSVLGFILIVLFFIDKNESIQEKWKRIRQNKIAILSISLYLIHVLGLITASNFKYAGLDLEIKLPLLIIPLALFSEKSFTKAQFEKVLNFFNLGNLLALITCVIIATIKYQKLKSIHVFFYNDLSKFLHQIGRAHV